MKILKILLVTLAVLAFSFSVNTVAAHGPEDGETFHHGHHGHHLYWTPDYYSGPYYNYGTPFVAPGCFWNWKNWDSKSLSKEQKRRWQNHHYNWQEQHRNHHR